MHDENMRKRPKKIFLDDISLLSEIGSFPAANQLPT